MSATLPTIILIHPQLGENIGAVARAMGNFGLKDLRLVAPREGWPNDMAYRAATNSADILDQVKVFATTQEAIADLHYVLATTARGREREYSVLNPRHAVEQLRVRTEERERVGIMFGPERTGLINEDIVLANALVTIPTAPEKASLNIAQSVVLMAYEWFMIANWQNVSASATTSARASAVNMDKGNRAATREEMQGFFDHLERYLDESDFFKGEEKKPSMWRNLRHFFLKGQATEQEVRTLHGMIKSLWEKM